LVPLPRGGLALAPPLAVAAGEPPAALAVAVVDRPALALADLGAALAAGEGVAEHRDRRAADVDRRGDRGDHLVATQGALAPGGAVATGRDTPAARSGRRPALAPGEGVAEHRDRRAADVDRRGDRGDHLVATQDALAPGGAVATGRDTPAARTGRRPALAVGLRPAEDRDRGAAGVDRRADRGDHLVAAQDALAPGGAVATGRGTLPGRAGLGPALAPGVRLAEERDRVAADVDRGSDRRVHLVAAQDALAPGGPVARAPAAADGGGRAAVGEGLRVAADAHRVAADVDREIDGEVDLVAATDRAVTDGVGVSRTAAKGHDTGGEEGRGSRALRPRSHDECSYV